MKFMQASMEHLEKHYADVAVNTGPVMLGETNPANSKPGTIRGDSQSSIHSIGLVELVAWESVQKDWIYE